MTLPTQHTDPHRPTMTQGKCRCEWQGADEFALARHFLAEGWDAGKQKGLRIADYEYGATPTMPDLTNPYREDTK